MPPALISSVVLSAPVSTLTVVSSALAMLVSAETVSYVLILMNAPMIPTTLMPTLPVSRHPVVLSASVTMVLLSPVMSVLILMSVPKVLTTVTPTCNNIMGSFDYACNAGFSGDGVTCSDIDECSSSANDCDANADCVNQAGGFSCVCEDDYFGDGRNCQVVHK